MIQSQNRKTIVQQSLFNINTPRNNLICGCFNFFRVLPRRRNKDNNHITLKFNFQQSKPQIQQQKGRETTEIQIKLQQLCHSLSLSPVSAKCGFGISNKNLKIQRVAKMSCSWHSMACGCCCSSLLQMLWLLFFLLLLVVVVVLLFTPWRFNKNLIWQLPFVAGKKRIYKICWYLRGATPVASFSLSLSLYLTLYPGDWCTFWKISAVVFGLLYFYFPQKCYRKINWNEINCFQLSAIGGGFLLKFIHTFFRTSSESSHKNCDFYHTSCLCPERFFCVSWPLWNDKWISDWRSISPISQSVQSMHPSVNVSKCSYCYLLLSPHTIPQAQHSKPTRQQRSEQTTVPPEIVIGDVVMLYVTPRVFFLRSYLDFEFFFISFSKIIFQWSIQKLQHFLIDNLCHNSHDYEIFVDSPLTDLPHFGVVRADKTGQNLIGH